MDDDDWLKRRGYVHFDPCLPIYGPLKARLVNSIKDPARVIAHSFYPLIQRNIVSKRFRKVPGSDERRIEKKIRPICYSAHFDSHIFAYYSWLLSRRLEEEYACHSCGEDVLAYRSLGKKSNIDFSILAFDTVETFAPCTVICYDVSDFFGSLCHDYLKKSWAGLLGVDRISKDHFAVFNAITKYSRVDFYKLCDVLGLEPRQFRDRTLKRICTPQDFRIKARDGGLLETNLDTKGIPQGSPISAVLSNLYMLEADKTLSSAITAMGGRYIRYSDDILLIVPDNRKSEAAKMVENTLSELELEINEQKVDEVRFWFEDGNLTCDQPLNYLGFSFDGKRILIRQQTLARYHRKMRRAIRAISHRDREVKNRFKVPKKRLYRAYSHLGRKNFISYARRAHKAAGERSGIARQIRKHFRILQNLIDQIESP